MKQFRRWTFERSAKDPDPPVDVVMIQIREPGHPWTKAAEQSLSEQTYPNLQAIIVDNRDRSLSIGEAWNQAVAQSTAGWVLFMGDDDVLSPELVRLLVDHTVEMQRQGMPVIHGTSFTTVLDDQSGISAQANGITHTGMFLRQWLVEHPFDESLANGVGVDMMRQIAEESKRTDQPLSTACAHYYGYLFRQHAFMASQRPINIRAGAPVR